MIKTGPKPGSIHFQVLLSGAVIATLLFVWLASPYYSFNGGESGTLHNSEAIVNGIRIVGGIHRSSRLSSIPLALRPILPLRNANAPPLHHPRLALAHGTNCAGGGLVAERHSHNSWHSLRSADGRISLHDVWTGEQVFLRRTESLPHRILIGLRRPVAYFASTFWPSQTSKMRRLA